MLDLSIGIVTYNNEKEIKSLLLDIFRHTKDLAFQVYIVDNASTDGTVALVRKEFPMVNIIETGKNLGFGAGHNRLLPLLDSRYHLILNPDIRISSNSLKGLVDYMDTHVDVAMVTPRILNQDGTEQCLPKRTPSFRYMVCGRLERFSKKFAAIRREYTMADAKFTEPTEISFCTGCFMLLSTEVFKSCNGFDERFFMYLEDAELTQRAAAYGKIIFHPDFSIVHQWERTSAKSLKFFMIHVQSMLKFLKMQK